MSHFYHRPPSTQQWVQKTLIENKLVFALVEALSREDLEYHHRITDFITSKTKGGEEPYKRVSYQDHGLKISRLIPTL